MKLLFSVAVSLVLTGASRAHSPRYRVTDLGTLTWPKSEAVAINDRGDVVENADTFHKDITGSYITDAFLWRRGRLHDLGGPSGKESKALSINNRGQITGIHSGKMRAFLLTSIR